MSEPIRSSSAIIISDYKQEIRSLTWAGPGHSDSSDRGSRCPGRRRRGGSRCVVGCSRALGRTPPGDPGPEEAGHHGNRRHTASHCWTKGHVSCYPSRWTSPAGFQIYKSIHLFLRAQSRCHSFFSNLIYKPNSIFMLMMQ